MAAFQHLSPVDQEELDRVRTRNRLAKRKSRARQKQQKDDSPNTEYEQSPATSAAIATSSWILNDMDSILGGGIEGDSSLQIRDRARFSRSEAEREECADLQSLANPGVRVGHNLRGSSPSTDASQRSGSQGTHWSSSDSSMRQMGGFDAGWTPAVGLCDSSTAPAALGSLPTTPSSCSNMYGYPAATSIELDWVASPESSYFSPCDMNGAQPFRRNGDEHGSCISGQANVPQTTKRAAGGANKQSMLHLAARNGSTTIARSLLEAGASTDSRDGSGSHPLHLAVQHRRLSIAELLISYGADLNSPNAAGVVPLEMAVRSQSEELVKLLLLHGATIV